MQWEKPDPRIYWNHFIVAIPGAILLLIALTYLWKMRYRLGLSPSKDYRQCQTEAT